MYFLLYFFLTDREHTELPFFTQYRCLPSIWPSHSWRRRYRLWVVFLGFLQLLRSFEHLLWLSGSHLSFAALQFPPAYLSRNGISSCLDSVEGNIILFLLSSHLWRRRCHRPGNGNPKGQPVVFCGIEWPRHRVPGKGWCTNATWVLV